MSIITNEREWVEGALAARSLGKSPRQTLDRVAMYYHQHCGYSKKDIPAMLEKFLLRCDPDISIVLWSDQIDRSAKNADRRPMIKVDGVDISARELSIVDSVAGIRQKRLLFTLICLAKYENAVRGNDSNWVKTEWKQVMALANIVTSSSVQMQLLRDLHDSKLIAYSRRVDDLSVRVLCLDDNDPVLHISDFRNIGNQYMMYRGAPFIRCDGCDIVIKKKSNSHRYCPNCAAEMYTKQSVESVYRQRAASLYGNILN